MFLGVIALYFIPLEMMPDITYPTLTVVTSYSNVAPEDIETMVTKPIEEAVSTVSGVKNVTSVSSEGSSSITVEFEWGTNLDFAAQDMRGNIDMISEWLPEDVERPIVMKFDISAMPVLFYGITSTKMTPIELRKYTEDVIKGQLEQVEGVASATVVGGREREIQVDVDRAKLAAYGLSLDQLMMTLNNANLNLPAGHIEETHSEYLVRTVGEFSSLDQLRNTVVKKSTGATTYLKDVADVIDTTKEIRGYSRLNKNENVLLMVSKMSEANTLEVAKAVKKKWKEIEKWLPEGFEYHEIMDQGQQVSRTISNTAMSAFWGALFAIGVLYLFLRNLRPTFAIAVAIPLSIIATFIPLYFAGYTLNILTLGGLALGVGMFVDNAIVVIENTFRHQEEGEDRKTAAKKGASEVGMAITASTLTTVVVFLPMIFIRGMVGKLSYGLALTVAFSLLASLFVALTIVPMIASKIFKPRATRKEYERDYGEAGIFGRFRNAYRGFLSGVLHHRLLVGLVTIVVFVGVLLLAIFYMPTEFIPISDSNTIMFDVSLPVNTTLSQTERVVSKLEDLVLAQPETEVVDAMAGTSGEGHFGPSNVNEAMMMIRLKDKSKRKRSSFEVIDTIRAGLPQIEGMKANFTSMSLMTAMGGGGGITDKPVEIQVFGPDWATLNKISQEIKTAISGVRGLYDIDTSLEAGKPELHIQVDRTQASERSLTVGQVATALQIAMAGKVATRYREGGDEIDVRVQFREEYAKTREDIQQALIASPMGTQVQLAEVAKVERATGPLQLTRVNRKPTVAVAANLFGRDLGSTMKEIQNIVDPMKRPEGYFVNYTGEAKQMRETFVALGAALIASIVLMYMIMAILFEHLAHPFTILFTLPLAIIGILLALFITGTSISMVSLLGVLVLFGIIVNNGIIMIDYINRLRQRGIERHEAIVQGASVRLRPILMTAFTTILGLLPMAISRAEGSEMEAPMAIAILGGLFVGTLLTLIVVPVIYSVMDDISRRISRTAVEIVHGEEG
jgi:HAE1 family hydrophobic/amphiphilic exporter-1